MAEVDTQSLPDAIAQDEARVEDRDHRLDPARESPFT